MGRPVLGEFSLRTSLVSNPGNICSMTGAIPPLGACALSYKVGRASRSAHLALLWSWFGHWLRMSTQCLALSPLNCWSRPHSLWSGPESTFLFLGAEGRLRMCADTGRHPSWTHAGPELAFCGRYSPSHYHMLKHLPCARDVAKQYVQLFHLTQRFCPHSEYL